MTSTRTGGGVLDIAVLALTGQRLPAVLGVRPLHVEPLVLAMAPDHPLARQQWTTLAALAAHPVVTMTRRGGLRLAPAQRATDRPGIRRPGRPGLVESFTG
jgi:DNA-binding transcriptional LysR family regulator